MVMCKRTGFSSSGSLMRAFVYGRDDEPSPLVKVPPINSLLSTSVRIIVTFFGSLSFAAFKSASIPSIFKSASIPSIWTSIESWVWEICGRVDNPLKLGPTLGKSVSMLATLVIVFFLGTFKRFARSSLSGHVSAFNVAWKTGSTAFCRLIRCGNVTYCKWARRSNNTNHSSRKQSK